MRNHRATCVHSNPDLQSTIFDRKVHLGKGGTTYSFGTSPSRNIHISKPHEETQDAQQIELDALEDAFLPQEYEEQRSKPDAMRSITHSSRRK